MSLDLIQSSKLIKQGAEARIYIAKLHPSDPPILLKHRFSKKYRHSALDTSLTRARVGAEARAIVRCLREGIRVPSIRLLDAAQGLLGLEFIDGKSVRQILPGADDDDEIAEDDLVVQEDEEGEGVINGSEESEGLIDSIQEFGVTHEQIMDMMGVEIAKMHLINLIHGDLTTSNIMVRRIALPPGEGIPALSGAPAHSKTGAVELPAELLLIDFGLTSTSALAEDKAVDLYVLERAFASTHPDSETLFQRVLDAYAKQSGKAWPAIHRRLEEGKMDLLYVKWAPVLTCPTPSSLLKVRLRGRKRSMVG